MTLVELADAEICDLSLEDLAMVVLSHLSATNEWNFDNFRVSESVRSRSADAQSCIYEAMNWLVGNGIVAMGRPGQSHSQSIIITRLGRRAIAEGLNRIKAGTRLSVDLHPLVVATRSQFVGGDFEAAVFGAMRSVEIRVRDLAGADASLVGVPLMREAFQPDRGPLANPKLDPGERHGVMDLFAGAMGMFKNPSSHRQVDYANPAEASEVVLLADLLHRHLDRVEDFLARMRDRVGS
jgi:uncharacterized protein (TIGR02391 family)